MTITFLAGLAIGYFARAAVGTLQRRTHPADLAAIEKLHRADVEATLTQDPSALDSLWSDGAVNLGFPGPPVVGIKAMKDAYEKFRADYPDFKVLKYAPEIKDVQIADGWAIEMTYGESTYKMSAKDNPVTVQGEALRVLKRQSDGSWKFALVGLK
jgi:ketosteroid isomerase-like protein